MTSERKPAHTVRLGTGNLIQFFFETDGMATVSIEYDDHVSAIGKTKEEATDKMADLLSEFIEPRLLKETVDNIRLIPGRINPSSIKDRSGGALNLWIGMLWKEHAPRHEGPVHLSVRMKSFSKSAPTLEEAAEKLKTFVFRLQAGPFFHEQFIKAMNNARYHLTFLDGLRSSEGGRR